MEVVLIVRRIEALSRCGRHERIADDEASAWVQPRPQCGEDARGLSCGRVADDLTQENEIEAPFWRPSLNSLDAALHGLERRALKRHRRCGRLSGAFSVQVHAKHMLVTPVAGGREHGKVSASSATEVERPFPAEVRLSSNQRLFARTLVWILR